jgi:hypothetical protein
MSTMRRRRAAALLVLLASGCRPSDARTPLPVYSYDAIAILDTPTVPVLVGAGDIASCTRTGDEATAALLDSIPGIVFTTGDNAYPRGSHADFDECYGESWGRHRRRTRPAAGNHDYHTKGAPAYFAYFGSAAGDPTTGYYSYDLGTWHVVVLNTQLDVGRGSPQLQWLEADLAASPAKCTVAYFHTPRFSSGSTHGSSRGLQPVWEILYAHGVEVVVSGHEHNYERFAPQTPAGVLDSAAGIRQFVVGTGGGAGRYPFGDPVPNSEIRNSTTDGVLKLALDPDRYTWEFVPVGRSTFTDAGSYACH